MRQMQADKQTTASSTHMAWSPWPRSGRILHLGTRGPNWDVHGGGDWEITAAVAHKGVALD